MLIDGRSKKTLDLKDLNSLVSFEDWLKMNLSIYPKDQKIPRKHLTSLLEYIKNKVREQKVKDKAQWLKKLDLLTRRSKDD